MRAWRWAVGIGLLLVVAAGLWLLLGPARPVEVVAARRGPLVVTWSADAECSGVVVSIAAEVGGVVEEVNVREGDHVYKGQVLATVAAEEARQQVKALEAQLSELRGRVGSEIQAAKAAAREARASLERLLAGSRPEEIAAAEARLDMAESRVAAAEAQVRQLEQTLTREEAAAKAQVDSARAALAAARAELSAAEAGPRKEDIEAAAAELAGAEAAVEKTRKDLERVEKLYAAQAAPASAVDQAREAYQVAKARAEAARKRLERLKRGTRPETIEAARARKRAAEAQLRAAQAAARRVEEIRSSLAAARAELEQARAARDEAAANVRLVRRGPRPEDIEAAQARLQQAEARLRAAESQRASIQAAEAQLQQAKVRLAKSRVTAPADGIISRRLVDPGDFAAPGQPLFEMVSPGRIWVTALVDDQDISKVHVGQKVSVFSDAYPGEAFEGKVSVITGAAQPKGAGRARAKVVPVRIEILETKRPLRPGMELDVEGKSKLRDNALLVPNEALAQEEGKWFVWVVEKNRAKRREVKIGQSSPEQTEILEGLREGELVIVGDRTNLREGQRVRPVLRSPR